MSQSIISCYWLRRTYRTAAVVYFRVIRLLITPWKSAAKGEGAPGFEPGTSRSAVECSTTELYPLVIKKTMDPVVKTESRLKFDKLLRAHPAVINRWYLKVKNKFKKHVLWGCLGFREKGCIFLCVFFFAVLSLMLSDAKLRLGAQSNRLV